MAITHPMVVSTGIAKVSVAPIGKITASTVWTELFYTLKDSVNISQGEPTNNEIKVDQKQTAIAVSYEAGEFNISFDIPDTSKEIIEYFYNTVAGTPYAPEGKEAIGVLLDNKITKAMLKFDFESSGQSLVITNGEFVPNLSGETLSTNPLAIHVTATAKAAEGGAAAEESDVIFYNPI